ncbi:Septum formation initiator [Sporobacter termitidis DSM 10068]|uniref:Septum formation initiator n=1 Tax=Sporobacter termitidis DSM 10068 TaxID=1123282 RepID=A0A1M5WZA8_9FIRM|nr:cell division protein FtsL [Sporobacter termitidis]SHH92830.1 Septum formation initiator [Sporobacter termitidis DSM 10068]
MASRTTSTVKYASRGAVHGSNAYDLARVRGGAPAPSEPDRIPAGRPAPRTAPKADPRNTVKEAPKADPRPSRKAQRTYGFSLYAAAGFIVVAVLMVFVLLAHVRYAEVTNQTAQLQTQLTQLTEQERKLQITHENAFDVNQVEQYATHQLGMSKPLESQIGTISATAQDKAVVADTQETSVKTSESMGTFLASLLAYFK